MTVRPEPQDGFPAFEPTAEDWQEFADYCDECDADDIDPSGGYDELDDDGQPDLMQEYDDLYGYGPEFDSYDCYDEY